MLPAVRAVAYPAGLRKALNSVGVLHSERGYRHHAQEERAYEKDYDPAG